MRSSYTTVINGTIAGQSGGVAQAYMKDSLINDNEIYTWKIKVLYLNIPDRGHQTTRPLNADAIRSMLSEPWLQPLKP